MYVAIDHLVIAVGDEAFKANDFSSPIVPDRNHRSLAIAVDAELGLLRIAEDAPDAGVQHFRDPV